VTEALPLVTVIMPVVNEERHLADAVERILTQDYQGELEVIIAVGPSRDRTADVADELSRHHQQVHVVENPSGKTPAGLNAALARSSGDVIVRVDGHALIPPTYVSTGVSTLMRTGAANVGGIMAAHGVTPFESAVAFAMRSRFGVGGASFHVGGTQGEALTVYLGCFRRSMLDLVGGFDESMVRAQDWELNLRIREHGGMVWFTPEMEVTYRPRHTLRALARQYHDYGRWRREIVRRHPHTLSLRYLAAPLAVLAIVSGLIIAITGLLIGQAWLFAIGMTIPVGYVVAVLIVAVTATGEPWHIRRRLPAIFAGMHIPWGLGFLRGPGKQARS
jgi:glycosyltransferase involved in cell wall biosynthesis